MIKSLRYRKWKKVVQKSGLFDVKYYLFTYPDIREKDIDPVKHYIKFGAKEGRNPSKDFDTKYYLENNPDVKESGINPLAHYLLYGQYEARNADKPLRKYTKINNNLLKNITIKEPLSYKHKTYMDDGIILSIICRTYNHEKYIRKALDGFVMQKTNFKFEVLIGDDLSSDNTISIIDEYKKQYPSLFKVIPRKVNLGPVNNLIDLSKHVSGKYVAVCDGDDYWIDPYKLYRQVEFLENNKEYTICFNKVVIDYLNSEQEYTIAPSNKKTTTNFDDLIHGNYIYMSSVVYRWIYKDGLSEDNFNFNAMPADWQLHLHHANKGKIKLLDNIMGVYNKHSDGIWSSVGNISSHYKYALREIELFKTFETFKNSKYKEFLKKKQLYVFKKLVNYCIDNLMYEELYKAIIKENNLYEIVFTELGYEVDKINLSSVEEFKESLKDQNIVNVMVTSYNHENYIREALDSILKQNGCFRLKIIVGDDYSTDKTFSIIKEYELKYPELFCVVEAHENIGMRFNLKRCFGKCTGNFTAICEGDDYWVSDQKIQKQISFLRNNQDCSMCFNWLNLYRQERDIYEAHPQQGRLNANKISFLELSKQPIIGNFSACMYRTHVVHKIPDAYYNDQLAFDWLFNMYAAKQGKVGFVKELLSVYRIHEKGQWSANSKKKMQLKIKRSQQNFKNHFNDL